MSDSEEEHDAGSEADVRPVELETHRRTPPPLDPQDIAEISQISADIDDAEKFELTFEVVETTTEEEGGDGATSDDAEISKILTPPSANRKTERIDGNLDVEAEEEQPHEAKENDENGEAKKGANRKPLQRKSVASDLMEEFRTPLSGRRSNNTSSSTDRKRVSTEPLVQQQTPKRAVR